MKQIQRFIASSLLSLCYCCTVHCNLAGSLLGIGKLGNYLGQIVLREVEDCCVRRNLQIYWWQEKGHLLDRMEIWLSLAKEINWILARKYNFGLVTRGNEVRPCPEQFTNTVTEQIHIKLFSLLTLATGSFFLYLRQNLKICKEKNLADHDICSMKIALHAWKPTERIYEFWCQHV